MTLLHPETYHVSTHALPAVCATTTVGFVIESKRLDFKVGNRGGVESTVPNKHDVQGDLAIGDQRRRRASAG